MQQSSLFALMSLAFGLGMLHALDADHIMAVSGLSSTRASRRDSISFCLRWAIGHAVSILLIGACVYGLGTKIPYQLSIYAEQSVGIVLILIGGFIIVDLLRKNAHLHFHQHDGFPQHAHWHTHHHKVAQHASTHHNLHKSTLHRHRHSAVMVGILHGTAGSAPLLVLVPLAKLGSALYGMLYLLVFSLGVLLTMLMFGGLLGSVYQWLERWGTQSVRWCRTLIATSSIIFGGYLLLGDYLLLGNFY